MTDADPANRVQAAPYFVVMHYGWRRRLWRLGWWLHRIGAPRKIVWWFAIVAPKHRSAMIWDNFGISAAAVRRRIEELEAADGPE